MRATTERKQQHRYIIFATGGKVYNGNPSPLDQFLGTTTEKVLGFERDRTGNHWVVKVMA